MTNTVIRTEFSPETVLNAPRTNISLKFYFCNYFANSILPIHTRADLVPSHLNPDSKSSFAESPHLAADFLLPKGCLLKRPLVALSNETSEVLAIY